MENPTLAVMVKWIQDEYVPNSICPFCSTSDVVLKNKEETTRHMMTYHWDNIPFEVTRDTLMATRFKFFCWNCPANYKAYNCFETKEELEYHVDRKHFAIRCPQNGKSCRWGPYKTMSSVRTHLIRIHNIVDSYELDCLVEKAHFDAKKDVRDIDVSFTTEPRPRARKQKQKQKLEPIPSPSPSASSQVFYDQLFCKHEIVPFVPLKTTPRMHLFFLTKPTVN